MRWRFIYRMTTTTIYNKLNGFYSKTLVSIILQVDLGCERKKMQKDLFSNYVRLVYKLKLIKSK